MGQYGLTKEEVLNELWEMFERWVYGKTIALDDNNNFNYYRHDVDRFKIDLYLYGQR